LKQITRDHTMAQKLVDDGQLTQEQADSSPWNHVLWNALSGDDQVCNPELHHTRLREQDIVLLCTDGLTRHLSDERIASLLVAGYGTEAVCQALVHEANEAGGKDNVTVVVAIEKSMQTQAASTSTLICSV
jgi:serine/threonine protein phosphatase PrpC